MQFTVRQRKNMYFALMLISDASWAKSAKLLATTASVSGLLAANPAVQKAVDHVKYEVQIYFHILVTLDLVVAAVMTTGVNLSAQP